METTSSTVVQPLISHAEVKKHGSADDCWIVLHSKVWDVTAFASEHPGGASAILRYAGGDATEAFDEVHVPSVLEKALTAEQCIGLIDPASVPVAEITKPDPEASVVPTKPPLQSLISVHDFEDVARQFFTAKAFAFFSSAATDLVSHQANLRVHRQLLLRPRVLRNVKDVSIRRKILGVDSSAPFFVSPAAMAKLSHPDGELAIARGCGEQEIIQTISSNASYPLADVVAAGKPNQPFFFQLYVNSDRSKTEELVRSAARLGVRALQVTVDAPIPGKREADERIAAENLVSAVSGAVAENDKKGGGLGRVMAKYIDPTLCWEDIAWLKEVSGLPIVLKGIQTAADAQKAVQYGADAILLSNHGGRSLDTTQPAMLTLLEIHKHAPEVFSQLEIYVDGGFTRGTDVIKALALGATAVGLGRPFLYSLAYGQEGVEHLIEILKDEVESTMKLAGITDVDQAEPGMVNTAMLEPLIRGEEHPWIQWRPSRARL